MQLKQHLLQTRGPFWRRAWVARLPDWLRDGLFLSREQIRELVLLPPLAIAGLLVLAFALLIALLLASVGAGILDADALTALGAIGAIGAPESPGFPVVLRELGASWWQGWSDLPLRGRLGWALWPAPALWLWVRALNWWLPQPLHARVWLQDTVVDLVLNRWLGEIAGMAERIKVGPARWLRKQAEIREQQARRRWLGHRLFGTPWRRPDLCLVVLRGLNWLPRDDQD